MKTVSCSLLLDLGNSEYRVAVMQKGERVVDFRLDNHFALIEEGYSVGEEYKSGDLKSLIFENQGVYYAHGPIVSREFMSKALRPISVKRKSDQIVTELAIKMILCRVAEFFAKKEVVELGELRLKARLHLLVPLSEYSGWKTSASDFEQRIMSIKKINISVPEVTSVGVLIGGISVYREGVSAFFRALFKEEDGALVERPENKEFLNGASIFLDIGAGTTDAGVMLNGEVLTDSMETFSIGGNFARAVLGSKIKMKFGYTPSNMDEAFQRGEVFDLEGKIVDISGFVAEAKNDFAKKLCSLLFSYIERLPFDMRELRGVLPVGGGAVSSKNDDNSMADLILENLRDFIPSIKLVNTDGLDLRCMNIDGLELLYKARGSV